MSTWFAAVSSPHGPKSLERNAHPDNGTIIAYQEDGKYVTLYNSAARASAMWHQGNGRRLLRNHSHCAPTVLGHQLGADVQSEAPKKRSKRKAPEAPGFFPCAPVNPDDYEADINTVPGMKHEVDPDQCELMLLQLTPPGCLADWEDLKLVERNYICSHVAYDWTYPVPLECLNVSKPVKLAAEVAWMPSGSAGASGVSGASVASGVSPAEPKRYYALIGETKLVLQHEPSKVTRTFAKSSTLIGYSAESTARAQCLARLNSRSLSDQDQQDQHDKITVSGLQLAEFIFQEGVQAKLEAQGALFSGCWPNWKHLQCSRPLSDPQDIKITKLSQHLALKLDFEMKPAKAMLDEMNVTKANEEKNRAQKTRSAAMNALVRCRPNA